MVYIKYTRSVTYDTEMNVVLHSCKDLKGDSTLYNSVRAAMKLHNDLASIVLFFFSVSICQDGNFTRAEIMPAEPPSAKVVGQSSFADFGENTEFPVSFHHSFMFVFSCDVFSGSFSELYMCYTRPKMWKKNMLGLCQEPVKIPQKNL